MPGMQNWQMQRGDVIPTGDYGTQNVAPYSLVRAGYQNNRQI